MENVNQFSIGKLLEVFKKYLLWIILAAVVVGCIAAVCGEFLIRDQYTCTAEFLLDNIADMSTSELTHMSDYIKDAIKKLTSTDVVEEVIKNAGITYADENEDKLPIDEIRSAMSIEQNSSKNGFVITVTYTDPNVAYNIVHTYDYLMKENKETEGFINELGLKSVRMNDITREVPTEASNRNRAMKYGLIGAAFGAVLLYVIFLIHDNFDVTIRSEHDLKKYVNLPVLGLIPQYSGEVESDEKNMSQTRSRKA